MNSIRCNNYTKSAFADYPSISAVIPERETSAGRCDAADVVSSEEIRAGASK